MRTGFGHPHQHPRRCWSHLYISLVCIAVAFYAISNAYYYTVSSPTSNEEAVAEAAAPHCDLASSGRSSLPAEEKYMLYSPHSGFSNQVGELKNALLVAALLNRTLVLPPVFDHHAVALGSCPKFRVHEPQEMRALAWAHISQLIRDGRYLAIADVIDLSAVLPLVKTLDLRIFSSLWCGVDVSSACSGSLCRSLVAYGSTWGTLENCGALLSRPEEAYGNCVYGVNDDCRTTIWVHGVENSNKAQSNGMFQPTVSAALEILNQGLNNKKKRKRQYKRSFKNIVDALGSGSEVAKYQVLSFGSLFSSEYKGTQLHVDIRSSMDRKIRTLVEMTTFLPFTPPIVNTGKLYAHEKIGHPFLCAQLRLLDGQFKNHWEKTFANLESQLKLAQKQQGLSQVLHVFVMTDLPRSDWTNTYLGELDMNKSLFKVHIVEDRDSLIREAAIKLAKEDYGLQSGFLPPRHENTPTGRQDPIAIGTVPDILLYVEEVICSCATLGFVGTSGSTLSESISQLRNANTCSISI